MTRARSGTAYLLVVGVCALAAAVALTAVVLRGAQLDDTVQASQAGHARTLAQAGLEAATSRVRHNQTWRASLDGDVLIPGTTLLGGTFAVRVEDPIDGNPRVGDFDPAILVSTGQSGNARFVLRAPLHFRYEPHEAMSHSIYTAGRLRVDNHASVTANKPVRAHDYRISSSASMDVPTGHGGNLNDAKDGGGGGLIGGLVGGLVSGIEGLLNALAPSGDPPHLPNNILATYSAYGPTHTPAHFGMGWFNFNSTTLEPGVGNLVSRAGDKVIVLNAGGGNVTLRNVDVVGTLVIHNAATVTISGDASFEPLVEGWPALIIHGNISFENDETSVDAEGLIYATGLMELRGNLSIGAPIIAHGEIRLRNSFEVDIHVPDELAQFPPPGFRVDTIISVDRQAVARVVE